jgi:tetratricopeptide (TPR) repeat protein
MLRQELPENEVREAVIQVVAAGREQLKLFFDGEEPPHLHHWVYHLHHLASLTYNAPVFDDKASLWGDLAYYHFLGDELDLATTYIQYALAIPHSWPDALATLYFYLGCIKEKQEQWPPAIEAFQEAFALLVYQARITAPNLADLDPAELTTYQLTMINKVLQHLGQVYYQQKDSHLTQTYFRRAAEVQQTLYQTPQAFRPLFELECYLALPLFDSEKLIWLQKIIQLKQTLTADWPILRMELVKDYQRLIELERKIPSTKTGQERVLKAYTQATQQSIEIYGVDSDETKEVVYQWYNWALELPIDQMRLSYKLLRKLLGPKALVVQALRVKIADKWFNFEG